MICCFDNCNYWIMRNFIKLYGCIVLFLMLNNISAVYASPTTFDEAARDTSRSFMLYFRFDRSLLEKDFMSNKQSLDTIRMIMTNQKILTQLDSIVVKASASPEGALERNQQLARERAAAVKTYFMWQYPYLDRNKILTYSIGEDWEGLKRLVEADMNVPYRKEVLDIIDSNLPPQEKDQKMQQLAHGTVFAYIARQMLPYLRTGATCIVFYKKVESKPIESAEVIAEEETVVEVVPLMPLVEMKPEEPVWRYKRPVALKTNLLFDLATALNVEVEVPIGQRFSVAGEWMFPWWLWEEKQHSFELIQATLEGRYWLKPKFARQDKLLDTHNPLTGWFVGMYASMGKYDLEWDRKGYQGEIYLSTGVTIGYVQPLSRNFNMEFSISGGYLQSDYRYYNARQDASGDWLLYKQYPGSFNWIGPTKAKVSLIWYPHFKLLKKGGNQ